MASSFLDRLFSGLVAISIAGSQVGQRPTLNFVSGATAVDNPSTNSVDVTITGGGGGGVSSINAATGALTLAAGSGISIGTSGTTITIASVPSVGSNGQVRVTASGVGAWVTASGDWTGAVSANVVSRIRGASVSSSAGALTVGAVLRVTGISTLDYGAVDLANANAVTGNLPVTNIAPSGTNTWVLTTTAGVVGWAAPSGGGGYTPPTGNGIPHITSSGQDVAAIHGSAGQFLASNAGGTDATFVTMSGDATLVAGAITVAKVNGITISGTPAAGNQPIASSTSAASWGALNLAGGANFVSGLLPIANLATPNFGSQTITTTGATNTGTLTATGLAIAASLRVSGLGAGIGHLDGSGNLTSALVTSLDIDASVASTSYVDTKVQGLSTKASVLAATSAALPTVTYSNGAGGVGATLTCTSVGAVTIDGQATVLNGRYLIKDQVATLQNGLFACSTLGTAGVAAVFTRTTDFDQAAEMPGAYVFVEDGTANNASGWVMSVDAITVGTTGIVWTQFSGAGEITVVAPLVKTGNQLSLSAVTIAGDVTGTTSASVVAALTGASYTGAGGAITQSALFPAAASALGGKAASGANVAAGGLDIFPPVGTGNATASKLRIWASGPATSSGSASHGWNATAAITVVAGNQVGFNNAAPAFTVDAGGFVNAEGTAGNAGFAIHALTIAGYTGTALTLGSASWTSTALASSVASVTLQQVASALTPSGSAENGLWFDNGGLRDIGMLQSAAAGTDLRILGQLGANGSTTDGKILFFTGFRSANAGISGTPYTSVPGLAIIPRASGSKSYVGINTATGSITAELYVTGTSITTTAVWAGAFAGILGGTVGTFAFVPVDIDTTGMNAPLTLNSTGQSHCYLVRLTGLPTGDVAISPVGVGGSYKGTTYKIDNTATGAFVETFSGLWLPPNNTTEVITYDGTAYVYGAGCSGGCVVQYTLAYGSAQIGNVAQFKAPLGWKIVGATVRVVTTQVGGTITVDAGTTSAGVDIIANHTPGSANSEVAHTGTGLLGGAEILCNGTSVFFGIHGSGSTSVVGSLVFSVRMVQD